MTDYTSTVEDNEYYDEELPENWLEILAEVRKEIAQELRNRIAEND